MNNLKNDLTNEEKYDNVFEIKDHLRKKYLKTRIEELEGISKVLRLMYVGLRPFAKYYKIYQLTQHLLEVRDETIKVLNKNREEFSKLT